MVLVEALPATGQRLYQLISDVEAFVLTFG